MAFFTRKRLLAAAVSLLFIGLVVWMVSIRPRDALAGLVPEHASWYIEVDRPFEVLKNVRRGIRFFADPGKTLFSDWQEELDLVQELFGKDQGFSSFVKTGTIGISAHAITGKESGYLYYFGVPGTHHPEVFQKLKKAYSNRSLYLIEERDYLRKKVLEITFRKSGLQFSLVSTGEALVGSFSGFLVEEVARRSGILFKPNFASRLRRDSRYTAFAGKPVRLFLNLKNAPDFLQHYIQGWFPALQSGAFLGEGILLGFDGPEGLDWKSEGFVLMPDGAEKFKNPNALGNGFESFIPQPAVIAYQLSVSSIFSRFRGKKEGQESQAELLKQALEDELLFGLAEGDGLRKYQRVLVTRIRKKSKLAQWLEATQMGKDTLEIYRELFNGVVIRQHPDPGLAQSLGGSLMSPWVPLFLAEKDGYLLFSDDVEMIRKCLESYAVTSKNQGLSDFRNHHFRLKIRVPNTMPLLMESASGPLKTQFKEWLPLFQTIQEIRMEDLGEAENPSISLHIKLKIPSGLPVAFQETKKIFLDSAITSPPFRLEPRTSSSYFWAFQDLKQQGHILSQDLSSLCRISMGERWISRPQVIESSKGKDFSVLYCMPHALRAASVDGKWLPQVQIRLPDSLASIEHARLADYDQNFDYRVFIASRYGPVFAAVPQTGRFLEGWNPRPGAFPLTSAPRHIRIGERDYILMAENNGSLVLTNRKGEIQEGFPFQLKSRSDQPIFVEPGLGPKNSYFYCLSELGQMEKVNFEGTPRPSFQMFRPEKDTRFQFCIDPKQKTFAIARITGNKVTLFDQGYRALFETEIASSQVWVQYFQFGASQRFFAISDFGNKTCRLFNETGVVLHASPFQVTQPVDIVRDLGPARKFKLLTVFENRVSLWEFTPD